MPEKREPHALVLLNSATAISFQLRINSYPAGGVEPTGPPTLKTAETRTERGRKGHGLFCRLEDLKAKQQRFHNPLSYHTVTSFTASSRGKILIAKF